jgi:alanyl aminopeptidase
MRRLITALALLGALATSLATTSWATTADDVDYRVPKAMEVLSQTVDLRLDPDADDYRGTTTLTLRLTDDLEALALHWIDLDVTKIRLSQEGSERSLTARAGDYDMHWLSDGETIPAGGYQLTLDFSGAYSTDALGLYKASAGGENYLFTQYEMTLARRTMPLVDEPDSKIPWQVTLRAPKRFKVAANTPVVTETESSDGWVTRTFKQTPPMPSYLLAMAVGNFDVTPIDGMDIPGVIYSPKGTGGATGFAMRQTAPILAALEDYFGRSYPYEKLDFVAVPNFTFGAMENAGLVTYRTELLLRGDDPAPDDALSTVNVIAHELAHMWYGNLVTMAWWDDLWLNEAFASWMANKVTASLYPQYQSDLSLPQAGAFPADALGATKPIRKEVRTEEDVLDGLGLNYSKGHAILNMLEQSIGEDSFRAAIRDYMAKHQWGNTVAADLWSALSRHAAYDVGAVAATFLNQAGYPLIEVSADGHLHQQRYENLGAGLPAQTWEVPIAMKLKTDDGIQEVTVTLKGESAEAAAVSEADWVLPGSNGNGYYVWHTSPKQYAALLQDIERLSDREKAALLINGSQLLGAGVVDMGQHAALLAAMAEQRNEEIVLKSVEGLRSIADMYRGTYLEADLARLVSQQLMPWYLKLGPAPKPDDNESAVKLRARVLRTLAEFGADASVAKTLAKLADAYIADPDGMDAGIGFEALRVNALRNGDLALAKRYLQIYQQTDNATLKSQLRGAMYFADNEAAALVMTALANGEVVSGDVARMLSGLFYANHDQSALYDLLETHYDDIAAKIPEFYRPNFPQIVSPGCNVANLELQQAFFSERGNALSTSLSKSQEAARNCIDRANRGRSALESYLQDQAAKP